MSAPTGAGAYQMPVALRPYPHSQADASGHRSQVLIGNPEEHTQMIVAIIVGAAVAGVLTVGVLAGMVVVGIISSTDS